MAGMLLYFCKHSSWMLSLQIQKQWVEDLLWQMWFHFKNAPASTAAKECHKSKRDANAFVINISAVSTAIAHRSFLCTHSEFEIYYQPYMALLAMFQTVQEQK